MVERREQEKPLAPVIPANSKLSPFPPEFISHRRHRCLKCCGCSAALLLILAFTTLILTLTIFHVKHPSLEIISVKIDGLNSLSNNNNPTLVAGVSIKNPNAASFKFHEAATEVYYDGSWERIGRHRGRRGTEGGCFGVPNSLIVAMDDQLIKPIRAPLLLKDHLLEDMSSCSSNGFKSFPRRQCCTTLRFRRRQKARADFV
ncbi:hypothetical protein SASPL_129235 [Salvia splendens]|uniref:Late embryogenesis abundant protein LEA-2 subgroup domain-containing protein n=1 Tax=Salvia splendens TaxID=180675 RepID=A0A8X8XCS3_SALSN|nr:hypothetical protein SASPL_129235 [Salvia splendens]